jgi:hypothetical protein
LVRLEPKAIASIMQPGKARELHVQLSDGKGPPVTGVIALEGIFPATELLKSLCPAR